MLLLNIFLISVPLTNLILLFLHFVHFELIILFFAILLLLILSAFFSGSETALTASTRSRLTGLSIKGHKNAKTAIELLNKNTDFPINKSISRSFFFFYILFIKFRLFDRTQLIFDA